MDLVGLYTCEQRCLKLSSKFRLANRLFCTKRSLYLTFGTHVHEGYCIVCVSVCVCVC